MRNLLVGYLAVLVIFCFFACDKSGKVSGLTSVMALAKKFAEGSATAAELKQEFASLKPEDVKKLPQQIDSDGNSFLRLLRGQLSSAEAMEMAKEVLSALDGNELGAVYPGLNSDNKKSWVYFFYHNASFMQAKVKGVYAKLDDDEKKALRNTLLLTAYKEQPSRMAVVIGDADLWGFKDDLFKADFNLGQDDGKVLAVLAKELKDLTDSDKRQAFKLVVIALQKHYSGNWLKDFTDNADVQNAIKPYCGADISGLPCHLPLLAGADPQSVLYEVGFSPGGFTAPLIKEMYELFLAHASDTHLQEFFSTPVDSAGSGMPPGGGDGYVVHNLAFANTLANVDALPLLEKLLKKAKERGIDSKINAKIGTNNTPLENAKASTAPSNKNDPMAALLKQYGAT